MLASLALVWDSRNPRGEDMNRDGIPDVNTAPYADDSPDWTLTRRDDAPLE